MNKEAVLRRINSVSQLIGLLGFEITSAGQQSVAASLEDGRTEGAVALEIMVQSIQHAMHVSETKTAEIDPEVMLKKITAIGRWMLVYVEAGDVSAISLMRSLVAMKQYVCLGAKVSPAHLMDSTPPAVCCGHVWRNPEGRSAYVLEVLRSQLRADDGGSPASRSAAQS